jgi:hypothetical protein
MLNISICKIYVIWRLNKYGQNDNDANKAINSGCNCADGGLAGLDIQLIGSK